MALPRALIEMVVDGAAESRRRIETVGDALRRMNNESLQRISSQIGDVTDRYSNLQSTIGGIAGFAIAGVSLATLGSKIGDVLGSMGELDDLSQKIGSSVESLSKIQKVTKAFGVDFAGSVDPALVKLAKGLTTVDDKSSKTAKALAALGVSANTMSDPSEVLIEVAKNLQRYEDGAAKAAVVSDLFGKSAADLLPFFNDLAETVDDFSTVSADAVGQAAALQDKFGMLGVRTDEIFTAITVAALPAFSNLTDGFSDVLKAEDGLVDSGEIAGWADDLGLGFSRVADVAVLLPRIFSAVSSSFKVVAADVSLIWAATPANMAVKYARGGSPLEDLKRAAAERNGILEEANKKYDDLWNKPADQFEQAYIRRRRGSDAAAVGTPASGKGQLNYSSSGDDSANDAKRTADAYSNLTAAIQAKITASKLELGTGVALEPSQQEQLKLTEQLAGLKGKLTPIQQANAESMIKEHVTLLEVIESNKRAAEGLESYNKVRAQYETSAAKVIEDAMTEATRNEQLALTYGKTRGAIEAEELARLENQLAQRASTGLTLDEITNLEKLIAAKKRNATALGQIDTMEAGKKAAESLDEFLDPAKAQSFGEALRESLGGAGTALSALSATFDGFTKRQAEFDKQRENAKLALNSGQKTEMQYMQDMARLSETETKNRLSGYGDMAGAAAGFFGEQSRGYQTLMTVSKVFHAAELAMTLAELVPKGISAVLSQGSGDPYTAFGRMAAMAAIVAGLGVAIGSVSGSSVSVSEARQKKQGTGSVLGSDEKSDSIANSLSLIESSTSKSLNISNGMLTSLRNIEAGIGQFASLLVRTTGVSGEFGSEFATKGSAAKFGQSTVGVLATGGIIGLALDKLTGGWVGKITGSVMNSIFGGKQTVEDTGFTMGRANFGSILTGGVAASQYADIKKDGGWFSSDKRRTQLEGIGTEGNRQIGTILTSLYDTVFEAGKLLGISGDAFSTQLNSFVVDIGKISLKDKTGEQIQEELSAVFSKVGDDLASFGVAGITQFQKVGEGALETLARVATNYASLDAVLGSLGKTFGATGIASIAAREDLLTMVGGIDELASKTSSFAENFLTEAERLAPVQKYVTEQLALMGKSDLRSRDSFKQYVLGLDLTNAAQRAQYSALMNLQEEFAQLYPEIENGTKSIADAKTALADAYNAENDAISSTIDRLTSFASSLKNIRESALLGGLSPLSPQQKYVEAKAQYEAVLAAARGGDADAQSNYQAAFNSFLTASRAVFASSGQYQYDFDYAQASTAEAERWANAQVDVGKAQLDVLKLSVSGLIDINKSVLSVRDAIAQHYVAEGKTPPDLAPAAPVISMPTPVMYASYGADNTTALVAEVKRLNGLVEKLTADQNKQTGDMIKASAAAAKESAEFIANAAAGAVKSAAYSEQRVHPQ